MEKEINVLSGLLAKPKKPFVALIGGVKISTKIGVIANLLKKVQWLLLGGALVNNFFKAAGYGIGASIFEPKELKTAKKFLKNKKIVLPVDLVVGDFRGKKFGQFACHQNPAFSARSLMRFWILVRKQLKNTRRL